MAKTAAPTLSEDKVKEIFQGLKSLMPPKKPTLSEILDDNKAVIVAAINKGNSLRDIAKYLSDSGLKTSHETLRKTVEKWGQSNVGSKPKQAKKQDENTEKKSLSTAENDITNEAASASKPGGSFNVTPDRKEY